MSYRDIPERFQPDEIVDNVYYFAGQAYQRVETIKVEEEGPLAAEFSKAYTIVSSDATTEEQVTRLLSGVRTVRNLVVDVEYLCGQQQRDGTDYDTDVVTQIVVVRASADGQPHVMDRDILCSDVSDLRPTNIMYASQDNLYWTVSKYRTRLCYPGILRLYSGDSVVVRVSAQISSGERWLDINIGSTAFVKF